MLEPATSVSVSVGESAVTVFCRETAILANKFCAPPHSQLKVPEPSVGQLRWRFHLEWQNISVVTGHCCWGSKCIKVIIFSIIQF